MADEKTKLTVIEGGKPKRIRRRRRVVADDLVEKTVEDAPVITPVDKVDETPDKSTMKGEDKLTNNQRHFKNLMLKGAKSQSAAYREAYNAENMSDRAISTEASRLMDHPIISRLLDAGYAAQEVSATRSAASLRSLLEEKLLGIIEKVDDKSNDTNKMRAIELLGKSQKVGYFLERSTDIPTETMTQEELETEIAARLEKAFAS